MEMKSLKRKVKQLTSQLDIAKGVSEKIAIREKKLVRDVKRVQGKLMIVESSIMKKMRQAQARPEAKNKSNWRLLSDFERFL